MLEGAENPISHGITLKIDAGPVEGPLLLPG
jgi:hypothetical protein